MSIFSRKFKGVWLPVQVWLASDISLLQKILIVEINSLDNGERGCFASNRYFSEFLQIGESQVSRLINALVKQKILHSEISIEKGRNNERRLHLTAPISILFSTESVKCNSERSFQGVWIPSALWLAKGLTPIQKFLLVEIDSLDNGERGCFASNAYLAKFLNVSESQVSRIISTLVKSQLVTSKTDYSNRHSERRLYVNVHIESYVSAESHTEMMQEGIRKNAEGVAASVRNGYPHMHDEGISKNAEHINTVNNTVNNTNEQNDFDKFWTAYPNKKCGKTKARESYKKALKNGADISTILDSISTHKKTRAWADNYIPLATTWLNQHRWEAEFDASDFILIQPNQNNASKCVGDNTELDALLMKQRRKSERVVSTNVLFERSGGQIG